MSLGVHYDIWQKFTIFVEEDLCYVSLPVHTSLLIFDGPDFEVYALKI